MTTLLQRLQEDMRLRNLASSTQASYIHHVSMFARHFVKSPENIAPEEIRSYQLYLSTEKRFAPPTVAIAVSALRFLYRVTLQRSWVMDEAIPMAKRPETLPVLSPDEVLEFIECVRHAKHRAILMSFLWEFKPKLKWKVPASNYMSRIVAWLCRHFRTIRMRLKMRASGNRNKCWWVKRGY